MVYQAIVAVIDGRLEVNASGDPGVPTADRGLDRSRDGHVRHANGATLPDTHTPTWIPISVRRHLRERGAEPLGITPMCVRVRVPINQ